jgi:poly-gamma-glutamate capsule biosynthesis protein CapA/YwtB (metallophosphatase superfamily)
MNRRHFLAATGAAVLAVGRPSPATEPRTWERHAIDPDKSPRRINLFLCGDVMTGRGIDQVLPHPSRPKLHEPYVSSALCYVELAEEAFGPIRRPVDFSYIWGDALELLRRIGPDLRIVNLETAVTKSEDAWPGKGIHYRMHPDNVPCLTAAGIDCCVLANNHVMDWGYAGLADTLDALHRAGIATAGAGRNATEAGAPAILPVPGKGRVLVYGWGTEDSGVPTDWAAGADRAGVNFLADLSAHTVAAIARQIAAVRRPGDLVVASLHWGGNWSYAVTPEQRAFAHGLIDTAGVDVVHGHSSHHVKGIEVYRDRPILYGCGDFLNDYEGIGGYEQYRGDLTLMYFPTLEDGRLQRFALIPTEIRRFQVKRAPEPALRWLLTTLNREGAKFGTQVVREDEQGLLVKWR